MSLVQWLRRKFDGGQHQALTDPTSLGREYVVPLFTKFAVTPSAVIINLVNAHREADLSDAELNNFVHSMCQYTIRSPEVDSLTICTLLRRYPNRFELEDLVAMANIGDIVDVYQSGGDYVPSWNSDSVSPICVNEPTTSSKYGVCDFGEVRELAQQELRARNYPFVPKAPHKRVRNVSSSGGMVGV